MTAPVIGYTADIEHGLGDNATYLDVEPDGAVLEITLSTRGYDDRTLIVSHDEARQIIAGLAALIT